MAKANGQDKGFRFFSAKAKSKFIHFFKLESKKAEDAHDAKIADAAYEAYLRDPSGARPLDELMAEWDAMDAKQKDVKQEKVRK
jgi:hypothetical protein